VKNLTNLTSMHARNVEIDVESKVEVNISCKILSLQRVKVMPKKQDIQE
jgi:hypothetical protein